MSNRPKMEIKVTKLIDNLLLFNSRLSQIYQIDWQLIRFVLHSDSFNHFHSLPNHSSRRGNELGLGYLTRVLYYQWQFRNHLWYYTYGLYYYSVFSP